MAPASRDDPGTKSVRVGYIVRSWPRLSQTFIVQEIRALERRAVTVEIFSLSHSDEELVQPEVAEINAPVTYLCDQHDRSVWLSALTHPAMLLFAWRKRAWDRGYHVAGRLVCLRLATALARLIDTRREGGRPLQHLHAHFIHDPAAVAQLAGMMTKVPWSVTAHARDLYQVAPSVIVERTRRAAAVVTICESNLHYLRSLTRAADQSKLHLIHNGVDLREFPARPVRATDGPLRIVSIARLVEKKGINDLVEVCRGLAADGVPFTCRVFGEGPMEAELHVSVDRLGLRDSVTLEGPRTRRELIEIMADSDVFALLPYVTADGDRDGIPTVLVEAMACHLPVVSTRVAGVPDLVHDGVNGFLVERRDVDEAADALSKLADDPELRARLGCAGRRTVEKGFDGEQSADQLVALFAGARA